MRKDVKSLRSFLRCLKSSTNILLVHQTFELSILNNLPFAIYYDVSLFQVQLGRVRLPLMWIISYNRYLTLVLRRIVLINTNLDQPT